MRGLLTDQVISGQMRGLKINHIGRERVGGGEGGDQNWSKGGIN